MKTLKTNKKSINPILAFIILIALTIVVSVIVAAWMGAISFTFLKSNQTTITPSQGKIIENMTIQIPVKYGATHVDYSLETGYLFGTIKSESIKKLPLNITFSVKRLNDGQKLQLKVTYYCELTPNVFQKIDRKEYIVNVTKTIVEG